MKKNKAFTLIELLVVVLIIGILAAVALPQYRKAVERSKSAQALALIKTTAQAIESYRLSNGDYPHTFDELPIDIPWPTRAAVMQQVQETRANKDWAIEIQDSRSFGYSVNLYITRISGKYKGAGFKLLVTPGAQQIQCFERLTSATLTFNASLPDGDYCQKIIKATPQSSSGFARYYTLP